MAFISKTERQKRIQKIQSADTKQKTFIFISFIITILLVLFILVIGLLPVLPSEVQNKLSPFIGVNGEWFNENDQMTLYGIVMTTSLSVTIAMLITSFVLFLTMKSLRWGFKETVDLMTTPIPGKSGKFANSKAKQIVKQRIAIDKIDKKKKK